MEAILTVGVSASGKTTWARQFVIDNPNYIIICRDDIRTDIMGGTLDWKRWNWKNEDEVTRRQEAMMKDASEKGQGIIIADTNLPVVKDGKVMFTNGKKLVDKLERFGYTVSYKEFDISLEEAIERDKNRAVSVGEEVIRRQYGNWLGYKQNKA